MRREQGRREGAGPRGGECSQRSEISVLLSSDQEPAIICKEKSKDYAPENNHQDDKTEPGRKPK